jgi:membrane-associated phospholipid phosphatase
MMNTQRLSAVVCLSLTSVCILGSPGTARGQISLSPPTPQTTPFPVETVKNGPPHEDGAAAVDSRPFSSLFQATVDDFRRLPSQDTLKWLAIGAAIATIGRTVDRPATQELSTSPLFNSMLKSGETIGGARLQLGGALATYAVGRMTRSPKVAVVGADLLQAQILAQTLTAGVKFAVRRDRPDGTQYSFPSGHTSVTFASATVLQRDLGWKAGVPAYAVATYVAASRIQDKRHFLSDVGFGAAIGIIAGRTVTVGRGEARFAVVPTVPSSGGVGVSFNWLGANR